MALKTTLWEYAGDTAQQRALKGAPRVRSGVASGKSIPLTLLFAELLFAHAVLDLPALPSVLQLPLAGMVWIVVFWCFWYFRAWVYGHIALTADDHEAMRWIKYTSSVGDNKGWH
jgi:hypothetical protein